jgi:hypothetical protein
LTDFHSRASTERQSRSEEHPHPAVVDLSAPIHGDIRPPARAAFGWGGLRRGLDVSIWTQANIIHAKVKDVPADM